MKTKQAVSFKERVNSVVRAIPKGRVLSYKEVAIKAGKSHGARVVGNIMAWNHDKTVPCHRVIRSHGKIGGYNGLRGEKEAILRNEGYKL